LYTYILKTLSQFNGFLNSNRGTRAGWPLVQDAQDPNAQYEELHGTNAFLKNLPGAIILTNVVPQSADAVHSFMASRMLPVETGVANSGGWAGPNYAYDPPPDIPPIILPPAVWQGLVGNMNLTGLSAVVTPNQTPLPGPGYPGLFQSPYAGVH
jgi:hypothetical protein